MKCVALGTRQIWAPGNDTGHELRGLDAGFVARAVGHEGWCAKRLHAGLEGVDGLAGVEGVAGGERDAVAGLAHHHVAQQGALALALAAEVGEDGQVDITAWKKDSTLFSAA